MFQRHKKSLELDVECVSMEDGHWRYENEQSNYTITMEKERCDEPRCKIRCVDCNIILSTITHVLVLIIFSTTSHENTSIWLEESKTSWMLIGPT